MTRLSRRTFTLASGAAGATAAIRKPGHAQMPNALLSRIKYATIGARDVDTIEEWYTTYLGYTVINRGAVTEALAQSWGTPESAGRKFVAMQANPNSDVYIRAVEVDWVPGYKAITTWGWNAIEIIVDDIDSLHDVMKDSPFEHLGGPANLMGGTSTIRAAQYKGPSEDVIYLTCETGDREASPLPMPQGAIDRPFIMILSGPDIDAMESFYVNHFRMDEGGYRFISKGGMISRVQGRSMDQEYNLGLIRCREKGNNIELDEYPADTPPRPSAPGQLPPGIAMTSFNVDDLDAFDLDYIMPPIEAYNGKRTASFIGPTGEITELIEEDRSGF